MRRTILALWGCSALVACPSSPRIDSLDLPGTTDPSEESRVLPEEIPPADLFETDRSPTPEEVLDDRGHGEPEAGPDTDGLATDPGPEASPRCRTPSDCPLGFLCLDGDCEEGCLSDRDCPRDRHCKADEPPHGRCLDCLTTEHCPEGWTCLLGDCVATCRSSADCRAVPETPLCDPIRGLCVACLAETDCPLGTLCIDFRCQMGCRSDRDCPASQKCDRSFGSQGGCFPCIQDADCDGKVCRDHECVIDCARIRCPAERPVCDPTTGDCVQCLSKGDCPRAHLCIQRTCQLGCETDQDCGSSLHCAEGSCVPCTEDAHCPNDQKCRSHQCTEAQCLRDTDCPRQEYCHPLLFSCQALPPRSCASDGDCLAIFPGIVEQICDPLTRTCIPGCLTGLGCLDLLGTGRSVCVDRGCYACGSDSDCPGVQCDPLDRTCRACRSDRDCTVPGWHCAPDGSCRACLEDSHCTWPQVCDVAGGSRCVDCRTDSDCRTPDRPICGKSKTCIAPCVNECLSGQEICDSQDREEPIGLLSCGDFDDDPCLEYGSPSPCGTAATCRTQPDGTGRCVCDHQCQNGQRRCRPGDPTMVEWCTQSSRTGCWYWSSTWCGEGETCSNGTCICSNLCSIGQAVCESSTRLRVCEPDPYTRCPVWVGYLCNPGYACSNGACR